jgi:septal ring factor EnvC (AmiA/AmiB activator)
LKQGFLTKSPPGGPSSFGKKWQKRWFVLYEDGKVEYYTSEDKVSKEKPKGTIDMMECTSVYDGQSKCSEQNSLGIDTPSRIYFIKADSKDAILEWMKAFSAFVERPLSPRSYTTVYGESDKKRIREVKRRSAIHIKKKNDLGVRQSFRVEEDSDSDQFLEVSSMTSEEDVVVAPSELDHWKKECSDMKEKLTAIQGELARTRSGSISSQYEERERWEHALGEKAKEVEGLKMQMKDVQHTLQNKERELESCQLRMEERDVLEQTLREEVDRLASELTRLKEEDGMGKLREEEWQAKESKYQEELSELKQMLVGTKASQEHVRPSSRNGVGDGEVESLEVELRKRKDSIVKLQVKRNRLETQFNESQRENRHLVTELGGVREELKVAKQAASQTVQLQDELEMIKKEMTVLQKEKEEATKQTKELEGVVAELKQSSMQPRSPSTGLVISQTEGSPSSGDSKDMSKEQKHHHGTVCVCVRACAYCAHCFHVHMSPSLPLSVFTPIMYLFEEEAVKMLHKTHPVIRGNHVIVM